MARGGLAIAPYTDRLLPFARGEGEFADNVVRGLTGVADPRTLPWWLKQADSLWMDIEALPAEWAECVLPTLRVQLTGHRTERALRILTSWGALAAPAVPELIDLLDTPHARAAAAALGHIGSAATDAADLLADRASGNLRPRRFQYGNDSGEVRAAVMHRQRVQFGEQGRYRGVGIAG